MFVNGILLMFVCVLIIFVIVLLFVMYMDLVVWMKVMELCVLVGILLDLNIMGLEFLYWMLVV